MLRRVVHSLGLVEYNTKKDSNKGKNKKAKGIKAFSPDFSSRSKDFFVKVRHVGGGQKELYKHAVPASKLMRKHHGMCVARPEVFKDPHHSVLSREELLLPGHKYILISSKDVEKLKKKHSVQGKAMSPSAHKHKENGKIKVPNGVVSLQGAHDEIKRSDKEDGTMKEPNGVAGQEMLETNGTFGEVLKTKVDGTLGGGFVEQSQSLFIAARDFYVSREKWTRSSRRKGIKGKNPFVPPLPKGRPYRGMGWQPNLPTVKELSP